MNAPSDHPGPPASSGGQPYPQVASRADYPAIERAILARWEQEDTFARSVENRPESRSEEHTSELQSQ